MVDIAEEYLHLARLALSGDRRDLAGLIRRRLNRIAKERPDLAPSARDIIRNADSAAVLRGAIATTALPIDIESKLELLRREEVNRIEPAPVWPASILFELSGVVEERAREADLIDHGVMPTRSLLFIGAPGVGKTLAARWLALHLRRPLLTLDLAAVMSSFLGRTGNNIRAVLDYARRAPSVLLLDEFDAIAKRRDDGAEVGELKRLVNVLLQAVDDWPASGLLVAATNHPDLLDLAVWRRFDRVLVFPSPTTEQIEAVIVDLYRSGDTEVSRSLIAAAAIALTGGSFADVVRTIQTARRNAIVHGVSQNDALLAVVVNVLGGKKLDLKKRIALALLLHQTGQSARRISELTGVSRDTLRKYENATQKQR